MNVILLPPNSVQVEFQVIRGTVRWEGAELALTSPLVETIYLPLKDGVSPSGLPCRRAYVRETDTLYLAYLYGPVE